ncbi:MAG: acyl-CoA thioesterase [Spirochaetales bacterium]|nr:acyl-CoA thioesterase [Spirochaetales bacterium]
MPPFTYRFRARPYDCDAYGHVNNAVYLHYLEMGRLELVRAQGLDYQQLVVQGFGIWVAQAQLTFLAPALPEEELELEIFPSHLGAATVEMSHRLYHVGGSAVLTAVLKLAFVATGNGRPRRWPEPWRKAFEALTPASHA